VSGDGANQNATNSPGNRGLHGFPTDAEDSIRELWL
jgi:hypothetical protein